MVKNEVFFGALNLDYSGLEEVRNAYKSGKIEVAREKYLKFRQNRSHPKWYFDWRAKPEISSNRRVNYAENAMNHIIEPGEGVEREVFVGNPINWDFNPVDPSKPEYTNEWTWSKLNRFDFWVTLGKAYWETGNEEYAREWVRQMTDWVNTSPVPLEDAYYGNRSLRWRTIEAGIRASTSWMDAYHYFLTSSSFTPQAHVTMVKSFIDHARHLKRNSIEQSQESGNWVTMECNGMATIAMIFPELKESSEWLKIAIDRLYGELDNQVYPDGAQIELTTAYHQASLGNFMAVAKLARLNAVRLPSDYVDRLEKMYQFNLYMMMSDGKLPGLNDASFISITDSLKEAYRLYHRSDFLFGATLGGEGERERENPIMIPMPFPMRDTM